MSKNPHVRTTALTGLAFCAFVIIVWAFNSFLTRESGRPPFSFTRQPSPFDKEKESAFSHNWPDSEPDYLRIRQAADAIENDEGAMFRSSLFYKLKTLSNKNDLLSRYGWAYVDNKRRIRDPKFEYPKEEVFYNSYEWSRIRFLERMRNFSEPKWRQVGEELLKHNINDSEVKYYLLTLLKIGSNKVDRRLAIAYAQDIIDTDPLRPSPHTGRGSVYYQIWLNTKDANDAREAVKSYRRYLELAPENDGFRARATSMIKELTNSKESS